MTFRMLLAATAAVVFTAAAGSAVAQENPMAPAQQAPAATQQWTTANVSRDNPFGDIDVDTTLGVAAIPGFIERLSPEQRAELDGRCAVIRENGTDYPADAVSFCNLMVNQ
jgi:hypothetical protein